MPTIKKKCKLCKKTITIDRDYKGCRFIFCNECLEREDPEALKIFDKEEQYYKEIERKIRI